MFRNLFSALFLLTGFSMQAQNLVLNPSFENTTGCVGFTTGLLNWDDTNSGSDSCSSPDLFATCFPSFAPTAVPSNWLGYQAPHTGNRYAGIILYAPGIAFGCTPFGNDQYREYIEGELSTPLVAGQQYCVSFYLNLAGKVSWGVDKIGVYFSNTSLQHNFCNSPGVMPVTPQLQYSGPTLMDTTNWVQLTWSYTAVGGESFLTIGNFNNNATTTHACNNSATFNPYAYYYIDDVSVAAGSCSSILSATSSSTNILCNGQCTGTASVTVSGGTSPYTYAWLPSGGTGSSASSLCAGNYTCTITDNAGGTTTVTFTITQPGAIQVSDNTTPENCNDADGSANASATGGTPGYTYVWSNGSTNDSISNLTTGSYTVTATDANGCSVSSTVLVTNTGSASADAGTSVTITSGQSTQLNGSGGITYTWSPGTGLSCSNCLNPVATPTITTTYTLTVTDSNGCTDSDTVTVYVDIACGEVYVPNAFSPNADHQNDMLFVRGNCIKYLDFKVYNRWGEVVFYTADVANGWDGIWRGTACETAVFTYYLRATLMDGTEIERQGNISLVK